MREILFRGKCIDNGEWVYGCLDLDPDLERASICGFDYYTDPEDGPQRAEFCVPVIPETVGQYTGLTDKNGTKIFEGDIVKAECDLYHGENKKERVTRIGTVIYDKKFCQFGINVAGFSKCYVLSRWKGDYNEVIGNIHDNPELLEGGVI